MEKSYKMFVDGVEGTPTWMTLDTSGPSYTIDTQDSSNAGVYQMQIKAY